MIEGNIQQGLKYISAAISTFAMLGAALAISNIFSTLMNGIARNPETEPKLLKSAFIGAGLAEAMGLFGFLIAILLLFVA
jgi:F0F1-type ATP synthase membrane subunit c/vacuolar-type H+-ATPase subunit K